MKGLQLTEYLFAKEDENLITKQKEINLRNLNDIV